jgi:GNAT superfamily N-acetyltransferase
LINIHVRPAHIDDCSALGQITVTATQDAFRGLVSEQALNWLTPEQSAANWAKNFQGENELEEGDYIFVAESEQGEVVGFVMMSGTRPNDAPTQQIKEHYAHELFSLQVHQDWQRKGIGRLLVARAAEELHNQGVTHLLVGVLAENPNRVFYERLGAKQLASRPYDWSGYKTEVILYGWDDIENLRRPPI